MLYIIPYKLFENVDQAKSILKKLDIAETDSRYIYIREKLKGHEGYVGWLTKMVFINNVDSSDVDFIIDKVINQRNIISSLPKPIIQYEKLEELLDDIATIEREVPIKKIYNELPSQLKSLIDIKDSEISDMFLQLSKLKDKDNFIKKISRYHTKKELLSALKLFLSIDRNVNFNNIIKSIERSGATIIHQDDTNSIIVCRVDYEQCRSLGADTSWCIVNSRSTFNDYVRGDYQQYIIYLTDDNSKYSKIGATIGFIFSTAHLKNDQYISEQALDKLLKERNFTIDKLKRSKDDIFKTDMINTLYIYQLLTYGLTKEEILDNKKRFTIRDLESFTEEQIDKYNLKDKIELDVKSFLELVGTDNEKAIEMSFRLNTKLSTKHIFHFQFTPRQLKRAMDSGMFDKLAIRYFNKLEEHKDNMIKYIYDFCKYKVIENPWRNNNETDESNIDSVIYALKYAGVNANNTPLDSFVGKLNGYNVNFHLSDGRKFIDDYLIGAGYKLENATTCFNIFKQFVGDSYITNKESTWLNVLEFLPCVKEIVKEMILESYKRRSYYKETLEKIEKYFPDIASDVSDYNESNNVKERFLKFTPFANYQNYGIRGKTAPSVQEIYDTYLSKIKDLKIPLQWHALSGYHHHQILATFVLVKLNKMDEILKMNLSWNSSSFIGQVIRCSIKELYINGKPSIYQDYLLDDKEAKKLLEWVTGNVDPWKGTNDFKKHQLFSLVYYMYGWGFKNYMDIVKNAVKKPANETLRIMYLNHVLSHLLRNKKYDEIFRLVDELLSWKMSITERNKTIQLIAHPVKCYEMFRSYESNHPGYYKLAQDKYDYRPIVSKPNSDWGD